MKTGVIFGAGSVGRGLIGQLFTESGLEVIFIDVVPKIIDGINQTHAYPHFTVSNCGRVETIIGPARAINSADTDQVIEAIANASILATSVGAGVLPKIAGTLALGLIRRYELSQPPINILLCENLHAAAVFMEAQLSSHLDDLIQKPILAQTGLIETSIGRMIPVPSAGTQAIHPAAVCVEPYKFLPYDASAVKGVLPEIIGLVGDFSVPFSFYADRKLYIHNLGHCLCAYLGELCDDIYIADAIHRPVIRGLVRAAMLESALALSRKYRQPLTDLIDHVDNLIARFGNRELLDTVERVGRDPERKLAAGDRFLGAYMLSAKAGTSRRYLTLALACGLHKLRLIKGWTIDEAVCHMEKILPGTSIDQEAIRQFMDALKYEAELNRLVDLIDENMMSAAIV